MTRDDKDIVSALRLAVAGRVGKERFELWFGPRTRLHYSGRLLSVAAPTQFFLDWIRANFRVHLEAACKDILGHVPPMEFNVDPPSPEKAAPVGPAVSENTTALKQPPAARTVELGADLHACKVAKPVEQPPTSASSPRKFASLASFVVGPGNRLALVSAEMVARTPGQITPLLVHGPTSVGKTHLLEGLWSAARKAGRGTSVVYLSAEQFTSQFLEALRGGGLPVFRRKYRDLQMLILDDVQFLAGKRATQVELLHTVDTLLRDRRQVVLAADRMPAELDDFMPELASRIAGGMVCRIEPPDYATRLGIVGYLCRRFGVDVPADVQRFIASRLTTHARELSGAICRLQATSEALRHKITLSMAEEALGEMIQQNSRVVRLGDIEKAVCKVFGLESQSLQSDGKTRRVSHPRMLAMWLARKHTRAALSEIGEFFGRRSHSTVISAQKRVDQWMAQDEPLHLAEQTWKIDEAIRQVERQLLAAGT